eukprot:scaffold150380_cov28-Tisochrysis_lutea.AAC.4
MLRPWPQWRSAASGTTPPFASRAARNARRASGGERPRVRRCPAFGARQRWLLADRSIRH